MTETTFTPGADAIHPPSHRDIIASSTKATESSTISSIKKRTKNKSSRQRRRSDPKRRVTRSSSSNSSGPTPSPLLPCVLSKRWPDDKRDQIAIDPSEYGNIFYRASYLGLRIAVGPVAGAVCPIVEELAGASVQKRRDWLDLVLDKIRDMCADFKLESRKTIGAGQEDGELFSRGLSYVQSSIRPRD